MAAAAAASSVARAPSSRRLIAQKPSVSTQGLFHNITLLLCASLDQIAKYVS